MLILIWPVWIIVNVLKFYFICWNWLIELMSQKGWNDQSNSLIILSLKKQIQHAIYFFSATLLFSSPPLLCSAPTWKERKRIKRSPLCLRNQGWNTCDPQLQSRSSRAPQVLSFTGVSTAPAQTLPCRQKLRVSVIKATSVQRRAVWLSGSR